MQQNVDDLSRQNIATGETSQDITSFTIVTSLVFNTRKNYGWITFNDNITFYGYWLFMAINFLWLDNFCMAR